MRWLLVRQPQREPGKTYMETHSTQQSRNMVMKLLMELAT
jgi:hypothetical protein